jgi:hypothetical protein
MFIAGTSEHTSCAPPLRTFPLESDDRPKLAEAGAAESPDTDATEEEEEEEEERTRADEGAAADPARRRPSDLLLGFESRGDVE